VDALAPVVSMIQSVVDPSVKPDPVIRTVTVVSTVTVVVTADTIFSGVINRAVRGRGRVNSLHAGDQRCEKQERDRA
jgi:hypothetical protein